MTMGSKVGVINGIAAGGVVLLCAICILLIRWRLRAKHKRRLAQINAGADELSHIFPPIHMRITDDDVARMPGTRAAVRRSFQDRNKRALYTPMSSRETLESKPVLKSLERVKQSSQNDRESIVPMWPLPRRCIRSDGSPLSKKTSLSPRNKMDTASKSSPVRATEAASRPSQEHGTRPSSFDIMQNKADDEPTPNVVQKPPTAVENNASPKLKLKPPPLFHDKRRSKSHGNISRITHGKKTTAGFYVAEAQDPETPSIPRATQSAPRRTRASRSMSVCSQDPGAAPTHLLPPLPFEIPSNQGQRVKSPTDFSGCGSLFSDNTSIFDDEESKVLSHAETDLTSICLSSPFVSSPVSESTPKALSLWSNSQIQKKANALNASKPLEQRPQITTQKSYRASIEDSQPGSRTSILSMSLIDPAFRTASDFDLAKRKSRASSESLIETPRRGDKKKAKRTASPSSPLKKPTDFDIYEDSPEEWSSTDILRQISGNEGSLNLWNQRPTSTVPENPFLWDPNTSISSSNAKDGISGHHRQNCVRISNIPTPTESPKPARVEVLKEKLPDTAIKHTVVRRANMTFAPPSRATFDIHYTPPTHILNPPPPQPSPPHSPTLSMTNANDSESPSPASAISTPTRKPNHKAPSASHPNRTKSIFATTAWPLPNTTSSAIDPFKTNIFAQHHHSATPSSLSPSSRTTSSLFNFPDPPARPFPPNWRGPKTPIRGPRALPPPTTSPLNQRKSSSRRSPSHSPTRSSPLKRISKTYASGNHGSGSPGSGLRASIMQLRRQNSEVNNHGSKGSREHKRYLSIGDDVFEGEGKENRRQGSGAGRGESPESFYSGEVF